MQFYANIFTEKVFLIYQLTKLNKCLRCPLDILKLEIVEHFYHVCIMTTCR